jgi:hypothetical protein
MHVLLFLVTLALAVTCAFSLQQPSAEAPPDRITGAFAMGWMLTDTNGDGIPDMINGKIVVPTHPSAAENTAAANLAARLSFGSTGLTPPLVISAIDDAGSGPRIWVGRGAAPPSVAADLARLSNGLDTQEGAVFSLGDNLAIVAGDDAGLLAAAEAFSARSPYQWRVSGDQLSDIADAVRAAVPGAAIELAGISYLRGKAGIHRAFLRSRDTIAASALEKALSSPRLAAVHELVVMGGAPPVSATNTKPEAPQPAASTASPGAAAETTEGQTAGAPTRLDLATLYTSRGLFTGAPRMPVPSSLNGRLYVPAGAAGIAMANLAARMGLEATGISLPLATPVENAAERDVRSHAVLSGESPLARVVEQKLRTQDTAFAQAETPLASGEGELRVVDDAFGRRSAILARGDEAGSVAALDLLSGHLPNLWDAGKQQLSIDEIRYDLHRFFSLRSGVGQAAAALYLLDRWLKKVSAGGDAARLKDVKAEVYADLADPGLSDFIHQEIQRQWHVAAADVIAASLRAGTRCCDKAPDLHYQGPMYHQATPTFTEDIVIPWEGRRLLDAVRRASSGIAPGQEVRLVARVSEGPAERRKLEDQLRDILTHAGADARHASVEVLCAYKQGYSWLMDDVAPALAKKPVAALQIDFARNIDPTGVRGMYSEARWVQELYPVDEMLARKLNLPLERIALNEIEDPPHNGPTYRVHAYDAGRKEILTRDFTVATAMQPYNGVVTRYEQVQVDTGWVHLECASKVLLDQRIKTDIEEFWDHYQNQTLPRVYRFVMAQARGDLRPEFQPPFDTLKMDIHMSEPDYNLDLDKERISSLEALQEDTFYSTVAFVEMMGNLETGRPLNYTGRIIPIVHGSEDGHDGRVHIEFYGKAAANPLVRLSWTDPQGRRHKQERNLPALAGDAQPRLIQARVKAGEAGVERLVWLMPADFVEDKYDEWLKVAAQDQVDRNIFPVEQARGQLHWLEEMHRAGIYRDDIAYPRLREMAVEFELPRDATARADSPASREFVSWTVPAPATRRPMITDYQPASGNPLVQWDEPIGPRESASILARLAMYPGVNVYWMGRSYLGENLWVADVMLPSPAALRSWAKETTLKASIVYSGRQHANEVSSTSHIARLGEDLVTDPAKRALLKQVNVVLHPITNPDGAQLAMDLARLTPDNLLHPGYHGSLSADVSAGQTETDPIYPESRTRRQLLDSWLPDAFLNPHGYPSHEWVQPFSEYTGWVQNRQNANPGREWWIPRGWFTSLGYLRDETHPYSKQVTYAIRDRIVEAERGVPGLLALETRMNERYRRFGQRWQPRDMFQPIIDGIRIYMPLKGNSGGGRGEGGAAAPAPAPGSGGVTGISPDVTWDTGYTEAPDETAHGDYLKLMASAGLAFDYVHLEYLAKSDLRIARTGREAAGAVQWRVERPRPVLAPGMTAIQQPSETP